MFTPVVTHYRELRRIDIFILQKEISVLHGESNPRKTIVFRGSLYSLFNQGKDNADNYPAFCTVRSNAFPVNCHNTEIPSAAAVRPIIKPDELKNRNDEKA